MITFIAEQHQGCYGCQANKHSQNNQALPDYTLVRLVNDFPAVLLFLEGTAGRYDLTLQLLFFLFSRLIELVLPILRSPKIRLLRICNSIQQFWIKRIIFFRQKFPGIYLWNQKLLTCKYAVFICQGINPADFIYMLQIMIQLKADSVQCLPIRHGIHLVAGRRHSLVISFPSSSGWRQSGIIGRSFCLAAAWLLPDSVWSFFFWTESVWDAPLPDVWPFSWPVPPFWLLL